MKTWQIWAEGYRATGQSSDATQLDVIEAETFDEAVQKHIAKLPADQRHYFHKSGDTWVMWGCRLFDNEADARRSFG